MNGVVGSMRCGDQVLGIDQALIAMRDSIDIDRVHVMDDHTVKDLVTLDSKIATQVPGYDLLPGVAPESRRVERLVQPAFETERGNTHRRMRLKILEPFTEVTQPGQFCVSSNPRIPQSLASLSRTAWP